MNKDQPKTAKCRYCGAEYGFTEANRQRERKLFSPL
jgi:hypothetical protein